MMSLLAAICSSNIAAAAAAAYYIVLSISCAYAFAALCVLVNYYIFKGGCRPTKSCLYYGRVAHARLKGGAVHKFNYPIFLAYMSLEEMAQFESQWFWWPIFKINKRKGPLGLSFCSFDYQYFLRKAYRESPSESLYTIASRDYQQCLDSISSNSTPKAATTTTTTTRRRSSSRAGSSSKSVATNHRDIMMLTHLTYFGYCFNPVSFYYVFNTSDKETSDVGRKRTNSRSGSGKKINNSDIDAYDSSINVSEIDGLFIEVNNTPWIEQHRYFIHHSAPGVAVATNNGCYDCTFNKDFHVSPFMEMDYKYNFKFGGPGETLWVKAQNIKQSTREVWFQANFELKRIAFSPLNLLYVLLFYPLHTRIIQVWIHVEAVKLLWKGVSLFAHPQDSDVDFFMGVITAKRLLKVYTLLVSPFAFIYSMLFSPNSKANAKDEDGAVVTDSLKGRRISGRISGKQIVTK